MNTKKILFWALLLLCGSLILSCDSKKDPGAQSTKDAYADYILNYTKEEISPKTELNTRQLEILDKLKTMKRITRKQYADMFSISTPTAARDLKKLLNRKLLRARGPLGPGRWYELV